MEFYFIIRKWRFNLETINMFVIFVKVKKAVSSFRAIFPVDFHVGKIF